MAEKLFSVLARVGVVLALVVVVLGAFTRLQDAGLGCPDWPGCYGFATVPTTQASQAAAQVRFPGATVEPHKAWWEMTHRYFAGSLLLVVASLAVLGVLSERRRTSLATAGGGAVSVPGGGPGGGPGGAEHLPTGLALGLLVLIICQAAFGAWTVTLKLWPQVVTAHLLGGFATLSLLWLTCLRLGVLSRLWVPGRLLPHAALALVVVVIQVALGGWVTSNYAALACPDFPTCHGAWWPHMNLAEGFNVAQSVGPNYLGGQLDNDARVAIHFFHRLGASVVLVVVGLLAWRLYRAGSRLALPVVAILAIQITLGILNVVLVLPLGVATAHNACGALLLLSMVTVNYRALREGRDS